MIVEVLTTWRDIAEAAVTILALVFCAQPLLLEFKNDCPVEL